MRGREERPTPACFCGIPSPLLTGRFSPGLGDDPAFRPGTWLRKQDKARTEGKLTDHQAAFLDALTRHAETVTG
ncbi:hypothetical protein [Kitasatospora sp. NPDC059599]|uniref:hypothetical protein n=1 Tax=Kitasatospora sp. NPDC059599 TaxID=3346880 RepID=UPI003689B4EA